MSAATLIWGNHPWQRDLVHVADLQELTSRVLQRQMLTRALLQLAYRGAVRQRPMSRPSRRGVAQNSVMLASSGDGGGATWFTVHPYIAFYESGSYRARFECLLQANL